MNKIIITSAIVLALSLSACSEPQTVEQLITSGNQYSQQGQPSNAIIDYKNAILLAPKNSDARLGLGKAYLSLGRYINAEKELDRAIELGASYTQAATLLAQVKTRLDKIEEVEQLVKLSDELSDADYLTVLSYAGMITLANGQLAKAQDYFSQAAAILPSSPYSKLSQAYVLYIERDFSQGLQIINSLLTEQVTFSEALLLQGYLYYALTDFEQASDSFGLYLDSYPFDQNIRFFLVNSLIKAEKFEQANLLTDELLAVFKNSPLALQYKAQLEYQKQDYNAAKDYAEQALNNNEDLLTAKLIAGLSSYFLGDIEQAYTRLNSIDELLINTHPAHKVLAVTKFKLGYYADAAENFASLEGLTIDDVDLLKTSTTSLINIGELDSALSVINKAEQLSPNNALFIAQKGLIQIAQNDINGIESLEQAIKLDSTLTDAQLTLAIEYLKTEQIDKAKKIANELQKMTKQEYLGYLLQGIIYVKEEQAINAIASFEKSLSLKPNNIASLYNLALVYQSSNDITKALAHFKKVVINSPEHQGALKALVLLSMQTNIQQDVIDFLIEKQNPGNFNLSYALAKIFSINKEYNKAILILESITDLTKVNAIYWLALGDNYLALEQIEAANSTFAKGLKSAPKNYVLSLRKIGTLDMLSDFEQALKEARQAYIYHENDARLELLLAYFSARNGDLILAKSMLNKVKAKRVEHHLVDSIEGEIALIEKRYPDAINALTKLYQKKPTDINAISLARALKFSGQLNEAEHLLEEHLIKNPTSIKIRFLLAQLYPDKNRDKKIVQYLALVEALPNNVVFLNNLAWNQYKSGQTEQALMHIEHAFEIDPKSTAIQESYGHILVANNKLEQGVKLLNQAISSGSKSSETASLLTQTLLLIEQSKK